MTAEKLGIPAVGVMTTRFTSAATLMCRILGMPDYRYAVIDHPVSSADDAALAAMAEATIVQARSLLLRST